MKTAVKHPLTHLLPAVYQRALLGDEHPAQDGAQGRPPNRTLLALLEVMTGLQRPDLEVLAGLETYFAPYQAPERFVPLLASWLDLDWLFTSQPERLDAAAAREISPLEPGRLRELVGGATHFIPLRGTARGLLDFMETATGIPGLALDEHVPGRPFHLRLWAPPQAEPQRATLAHMLHVLKPAYTTAEILTARDLVRQLAGEFRLPGLEVQVELEAGAPRPRSIHLCVLLPGDPELEPKIGEVALQLAVLIDTLTPPAKNAIDPALREGAITCTRNAGGWQWKKTFFEWHKMEGTHGS